MVSSNIAQKMIDYCWIDSIYIFFVCIMFEITSLQKFHHFLLEFYQKNQFIHMWYTNFVIFLNPVNEKNEDVCQIFVFSNYIK